MLGSIGGNSFCRWLVSVVTVSDVESPSYGDCTIITVTASQLEWRQKNYLRWGSEEAASAVRVSEAQLTEAVTMQRQMEIQSGLAEQAMEGPQTHSMESEEVLKQLERPVRAWEALRMI